ncbi:carboxymuconolactone decarboxylase family protein [Rhodococcus xishaensis]|uniref:Carboxymuconolactone decarboxylase family protein n=1 Tax=Rhodococcus xishaensis TaxID=2487364 RepID=A0A3S3BG01_9NOCA|nr:carboxymuconolactone decarboxylase family protein [Rhodococcus xishaensis]RVW00305.1 carboxymuconolactone decarboxylase family protein [Rhodococcus xishaensis]
MPRIPVHTIDSAPDASTATLQALAKRTGKVLNIHGEMAHSPVVLAAYSGISDAIAQHGSFDARTREAIALAVGAVDSCDYCQSAHTMMAIGAGLSEEQTIAIRRGDDGVDSKLGPLLAVVREATSNVGEVDDATWKTALDAGWTETELTEAFAHIAVNLFTNYFNHYVGTELDLPPAPGLSAT